ncbi:TPA: phage tail tape measure protein [Escherichia coli]
MAEVGNISVRIGASIDEFEASMRKVKDSLKSIEDRFSGTKKVGEELTNLGKKLTVGLTLPMLAAAGASIKAAGDFESMGYTFQAVSGATSEQMARMSELAKKLGNDITLPGTSATDAAAAMTELVKAGLSIDDTFKAAKATLQLSAAAQIDNAEAATIVGQALNAFGLSGDKAIKVADLLANSANASAGEITDMAYALQAAGAVANMAGQSIQDTVTAISLMANAGITGSDAGTSLKSMLMSLISPTDKAAETMQKYGISVYDANGKMKPLPALVQEFSTKLGGLSQEQRNAALATIFGSDAIRAANIVLMSGTDAWNQMSQAVNKAGGAQDVAASKMQGFKGALEAFKSTVETLAITIGEKLLPIVTPMIQRITDWINKLGELSPTMQNVILVLGAVAAAIGPLLVILGTLAGAIIKIQQAWTLLQGAFTLITGPVGIVIAAITAVIVVGTLLYQNWDKISTFLQNTWNAIATTAQSVWNSIANFFVTTWNSIAAFLTGIWNTIRTAASTTWNNIKNTITTLFNTAKNNITTIANNIWSTIANTWNRIVSTIKSIGSRIWNAIVEPFNIAKQKVLSIVSEAYNWGRNLVQNVVDGIKSMIGKVASAAKNVASTVASFLGFHSPAKEGPGSDADKWMPNLMNMLNEGIQRNIPKLQATLNMALATPMIESPTITAMTIESHEPATVVERERPAMRPVEVHLHIGTLVADDYGLKQLERKLASIRISENMRLGVERV